MRMFYKAVPKNYRTAIRLECSATEARVVLDGLRRLIESGDAPKTDTETACRMLDGLRLEQDSGLVSEYEAEAKNRNAPYRNGTNFFELLTVAFIILKLCGVISWSWLAVVLPVLFEIAIIAVGEAVKRLEENEKTGGNQNDD